MKQVISGKLAASPELRQVTMKDGSKQTVANFTIYGYDGNAPLVKREDGTSYPKGISLKCVAWGENATAVSELKGGDQLTASATMRYNEYTKDGKVATDPNYVIKRIDPQNDLHRQLSKLLSSYESGECNQIFEREKQQPDFNKDPDLQPVHQDPVVSMEEDVNE